MAKGKYKFWQEADNLLKLQGWARDGDTDATIAKKMGINVATLYTYKNKYSDIDNALKKGKEIVDYYVENALLKRALGYTYEETTLERVKNIDGCYVTAETKKVVKHQAPDVTAQIFWLKNRKPAEWRDRVDREISGSLGISLVVDDVICDE